MLLGVSYAYLMYTLMLIRAHVDLFVYLIFDFIVCLIVHFTQ